MFFVGKKQRNGAVSHPLQRLQAMMKNLNRMLLKRENVNDLKARRGRKRGIIIAKNDALKGIKANLSINIAMRTANRVSIECVGKIENTPTLIRIPRRRRVPVRILRKERKEIAKKSE